MDLLMQAAIWNIGDKDSPIGVAPTAATESGTTEMILLTALIQLAALSIKEECAGTSLASDRPLLLASRTQDDAVSNSDRYRILVEAHQLDKEHQPIPLPHTYIPSMDGRSIDRSTIYKSRCLSGISGSCQ